MGKKKTEILNANNGFVVVMASGTVLNVRANRAEYSASEIKLEDGEGRIVARFRLKDVSGIVDVDNAS